MKQFICTTLSTFVLGMISLAPFSMASTPDGITPAGETVCDPLKADNITKGLYGLCVAYCEAQDRSSLSEAITEEELEAILAEAPSGKILGAYNKKKDKANNPSDPDMPCIRIEEPVVCPCWTEEEANYYAEINAENNYCGVSDTRSWVSKTGWVPELQDWLDSYLNAVNYFEYSYCQYYFYTDEGEFYRFSRISVEEAEMCTASVEQVIAESGLNCN